MIVETYQSKAVLKILRSGKVYKAHKNFRFDKAYKALVDLLGLGCECPIFGCLKFHRKRFDGRVSSAVKLTLDVPLDELKLTEFSTWADFLYCVKFTKPDDYTSVDTNTDEVQQRFLDTLMVELTNQKDVSQYKVPQVILREIRPEWLVKGSKEYIKALANTFLRK